MSKILISGITLDGANVVPLLLKIKSWQSKNNEITIFGTMFLKEQIDDLRIIDGYGFIELRCTRKISGKIQFIFGALKKNILSFFYFNKFRNNFNVVYSISSILDLIIFPYILKKIDKNIKWVTVFDNIVPFTDPGNRLIRFLAWFFFQISLLLLKKADKIFVISEDLKYYLLKKGFRIDQIVVTTNGIENDLIKQAKKDDKYNIDALFVGRINETKGIYDMLKVLDFVRNKYPNFQFAIMGGGDYMTERQFKKEIQNMNLENNIQFLGHKTGIEKYNIIKSSRCFWFLSESESESFGMALLEAVCSGLPSFVYDLPAYKNIYNNNEVMVFKKNDYRSVAEKVIEIFDKQRFNNATGKLLLDKYSWDKIAEIEFNSFKD